MFKNALFTDNENSKRIPSGVQTQPVLTPSIVKARNKKDWNHELIDITKWGKRLHAFNSYRDRAIDGDLTRNDRRKATKHLVEICQLLLPLAKIGMRARWLEVESGVIDSLNANDRLSTAVMARALIEEANRCQLVARDLTLLQNKKNKSSYKDVKKIANRFYFWVLPKVRLRTEEELQHPPNYLYDSMDPRLKDNWETINDYVHPNYGSHQILTKPSISFHATIVKILESCYEVFFEISWLSGGVGTVAKNKGLFQQHPPISTADALSRLGIEFNKMMSPRVFETDTINELIEVLKNEEEYEIDEISESQMK